MPGLFTGLVTLFLFCAPPAAGQIRLGPGESTETAFRREIRGPWFGWLAAHDEGDMTLARTRLEEIFRHSKKIGIKRLSDMALAATLVGRRNIASGKLDLAREAVSAAIALDPDLPEARFMDLNLAAKSGSWGAVPSKLGQCIRATFADKEARRIFFLRFFLILAASCAALGLAGALLQVVEYGRRFVHDVSELTGKFVGGAVKNVLAVAILFAPFLLALDIIWYAIFLFVMTYGYCSYRQRIVGISALILTLPLFPVMDRVSYELAVTTSSIIRGAEALEESRYDQKVLDDLEATKNVLADDADIRFLLGRLYQALAQNDRALTEYSVGAQLGKSDTRCLINRGSLRFIDGDFGAAQEDFLEALRRDGGSAAAKYNLSLVYAETFRTVEAGETLKEARALDASLVQGFQDKPGLVKAAILDYTVDEARKKVVSLEGDSRSRRLLGHFRSSKQTVFPKTFILFGVILAIPIAIGVDLLRSRHRGYAQECQKCSRTFCRLCKPPGEGALLCSQCVHVYMKKDGVSIETKLVKAEEVRRGRLWRDRWRVFVNIVLPGSLAYIQDRMEWAVPSLAVFLLGVVTLLGWSHWIVSPRPGLTHSLPGLIVPSLLIVTGIVLGQLSQRGR